MPDSLAEKDYSYYLDKLDCDTNGKVLDSLYCRAYLYKARMERNPKEIVNAYKNILYKSDSNLRLIYADSMIAAAKESKDNALTGSAYLTKGLVFYNSNNHPAALNNYLTANKLLSVTKDFYLIYKVKFNIAQIKYRLGFYDESVSLLRECIGYYSGSGGKPYLSSLHSLGLCYNRQKKYSQSSAINNLGIKEATLTKDDDMIPYFEHSEGVNQYFKGNYSLSITQLGRSIPKIISNGDRAHLAVAHFYLGKDYLAVHQIPKALLYFKEVDKAFGDGIYIRPDLLECYVILVDYYRNAKDQTNELYYTTRLLNANLSIASADKYLSRTVFKKYDARKMQLDNIKAKTIAEKSNSMLFIFLAAILVLVAFVLILIYKLNRQKRIKKQRFDKIYKQQDVPVPDIPVVSNEKQELGFNPEIVNSLLRYLEKFEDSKAYLAKGITLSTLAAEFQSNKTYVSKVINHYKGKKTYDYVSDLKIEHVIFLLKTEKKFRNYTNKALAEEAGFSTTQHFTTAFKKYTNGLSPTYFTEQIRRNPE